MAQISLQTTVKSAVPTVAAKASRLFYIDHLRAALIVLVVLHHVGLVYGASVQGYYYVEPPFTAPLTFLLLLLFALINQAWFMGAFFLIAGYFTPGSFARKGVGTFLKDRLLRLGVPLLVFYFILSPISFIGWFLMPADLTGNTTPLTWETFWQAYPELLGMGPLWFVALLLIFSFGYAGWRWLSRNRQSPVEPESSEPSYLGVGAFVLGLALVSYLVRFVIPIGQDLLGFPTLAYLPQYLSFFVLGIVASRHDWFRTIPGTMGIVGFGAAVAVTIFLFPLAFSGQWFSLEISEILDNAMGNGHWQSAVYALWDSLFAVGMILGAVTFFRRFFSGESRFGRFLSQQSYAVYIIHIPIIVFTAYAIRGIELGPLLKFGLLAVIVLPLCFVVAYIIRQIPGVSRIL